MTQDKFVESVSPLPPYTEFYYVDGDMNLGEFAFSRAYIKFTNFDDLCIFKDKFDNYVFIDSAGNEYSAIVEFAPLQKMPRRYGNMEIKIDPKMNTIDDDPDFLAFQEELKNCSTMSPQPPTLDLLIEEIENKDSKETEVQITPLIEFLNKKYEEKNKVKEEKRRKKDEAKKKKLEELKANKEKKAKDKKAKDVAKDGKKKSNISPEKKTGKAANKQEPTYIIKVKTDESKANTAPKPKEVEKKDGTQEDKKKSDDKGDKDSTRIRNKDRPAREIYRPGMARQTMNKPDTKTSAQQGGDIQDKTNGKTSQQPKFKNRVFTRTKN